MKKSELAGLPAPRELLINVPRLVSDYFINHPDLDDPRQMVAFGTSGHRGESQNGSFNEDHILAVCQAVCEYRSQKGITGPLYMGKDTHALSEPAQITAIEVFAANGVNLFLQEKNGYTPTPVISHAILSANAGKKSGLADGVVITPSHNPPADGGFKYNPPDGGPAATDITNFIQTRANEILGNSLKDVKRIPYSKAIRSETTKEIDFRIPYIQDLENVIEINAIVSAKIRMGVDPLGGASVHYWEMIADLYHLDITVVNPKVDPTFAFMTVDHDGKIRMDCSSPYAMASLIKLKNDFDIAFGNDPDVDRHGIVTPTAGLLKSKSFSGRSHLVFVSTSS